MKTNTTKTNGGRPEAPKTAVMPGETLKTQPVKADVVKAPAIRNEPMKTAPVKTAPGRIEPIGAEPAKPMKNTPAKAEPFAAPLPKPEPAKAAPVKMETTKPEPARPAPPKTEPVRSQPAKAEAPRPRGNRISLELVRPGAKQVSVAGTFNEWKPEKTPLVQTGEGRWVGNLTVNPGRYEYLFVVDGQWVPDPNARESVQNPYGGRNSVLVVSA